MTKPKVKVVRAWAVEGFEEGTSDLLDRMPIFRTRDLARENYRDCFLIPVEILPLPKRKRIARRKP